MPLRIALVVAVLALAGAAGHAAYLYDWDHGANVVTLDDPVGDAAPARDITRMWWGRDETWLYARLDVLALPEDIPDFIYGIYGDLRTGLGSPANWPSVPDELSGIDYFVSIIFDGPAVLGQFHQWHPGGLFLDYDLPLNYYQVSENGGRSLEWRLPVTYAEGEYAIWGAVVENVTNPADTITRDITGEAHTPEPATIALLGLGLGGLLLKRRRRK